MSELDLQVHLARWRTHSHLGPRVCECVAISCIAIRSIANAYAHMLRPTPLDRHSLVLMERLVAIRNGFGLSLFRPQKESLQVMATSAPGPLSAAPVLPALQKFTVDDKPQQAAEPPSLEGLVKQLAAVVGSAVRDIRDLNDKTRMLALNAQIEAARAGQHGTAFSVVASEMQELSNSTMHVANHLVSTTNASITDLLSTINNSVRGTRLSDLALTNIDLIDRCLYERTCDVRWWATDSSLTDALASPTAEALEFASQRLGVILDAYTVYHDLVLCDLNGRVIANGRPLQFSSVGKHVAETPWFKQALATASGAEYGFQSAHLSNLVNNLPSLIYSCSVRRNGLSMGDKLGVLGVVFNWASLAENILQNVPVSTEERKSTLCLIVDGKKNILASSGGCRELDVLELPEFDRVLAEDKGYFITVYKGQSSCVAHAKAPGFETYSTGWYSLIIQSPAHSSGNPSKNTR